MPQKVKLKLVTKDYDYVASLACGDVVPAGIELDFERDTANALDRTLSDESIGAGELSFSRHLSRIRQGDGSFVGIPVFPGRNFRHRCFFVRRDSGLSALEQLEGKRIGTNEWPASGNIWSRAALRDRGVQIEGISWWVGSVDGKPSNRPQGNLPSYVQSATDKSLLAMLLAGELDALMCPHPPSGFYDSDSPVVRLFSDYREVEKDYFRRTGIYPTIHIIGVRRAVYEKDPWVLRSLYDALEKSKQQSQSNRRKLSDTTPWVIAEVEEANALFGADYARYGVEPNLQAIQGLCDEQFHQGLSPTRLDAADVFPEFQAVKAG